MAIEVTKEFFLASFPELASSVTQAWEDRLAVMNSNASLLVSDDQWGDAAMYAKALLIAHRTSKANSTALQQGGGAITSMKEGDVSVTFAAPASSSGSTSGDDDLKMTTYGREFVELRAGTIISARFF
jgi:hypothetical protein